MKVGYNTNGRIKGIAANAPNTTTFIELFDDELFDVASLDVEDVELSGVELLPNKGWSSLSSSDVGCDGFITSSLLLLNSSSVIDFHFCDVFIINCFVTGIFTLDPLEVESL